ncbi:MAG: single-stranded DNA-binding protein [Clostridiales bacterium]|nr:single-stranded DNA-binding protein [Clostridiales bacterium]
MLNRIVLIGRLTRDPELRYTQSGIPVTSFALAVDRNFKNAQGERETDFINIVVWRQQAENCAQYLSKGKLAAVDGNLQIRSYTGNDGIKRTVAEVVADSVRFLSPKEGASSYAAPAPPKEPAPFNIDQEEEMLGDDDLPF